MKKTKLVLLDKEEYHRIDSIANESTSNAIDILKYDKIKNAFKENMLIVQGSSINPINIISSLPFFSIVFFELCPYCMNYYQLKPLLDTGYVFPILQRRYQDMPEEFVSEIIKYPHMTLQEFLFLRTNNLLEDKGVCRHCMEERINNIAQPLYNKHRDKEDKIRKTINYILTGIYPIESFDDEVFTILKQILEELDIDKLDAFLEVSTLIARIKTAKAFHSPLSISSKISVEDNFAKFIPTDLNDIMQYSDDIIIRGLELDVPFDFDISKYADILLSNRDKINRIAQQIISKVSKKEHIEPKDISSLINEVAIINDKIRITQKRKKYRLLKIGTDLLSANKGLLSTLLCATLLGFSGNLIGCGVSLSAGIAGKVFKTTKQYQSIIKGIHAQKPIQELKELILDSLEPTFQRLLSIYLWEDLRVIQAMRIKEKIQES